MPWPDAPLPIVCLLLTIVGPLEISADGNVGCLFSDRLCLDDEWCFDDYAFGRCLPAIDNNEDDLYRYNLDRGELHEISQELRRLFALGYRWSHAYTQCRLQSILYATKHDISFDNNACSHLVDQDLEGALKALEGQYPVDPREIAIIKYTPSVENPHARYADEIYYPPIDEETERDALREQILPSNAVDIMDMEDPYAQYEIVKRTWIPQMHRRSINQNYATNSDDLEFLPTRENLDDLYPVVSSLDQLRAEYQALSSTDSYNKMVKLLQQFEDNQRNNNNIDIFDYLRKQNDYDEIADDEQQEFENDPFERFTLTYNTPDSFRSGWESRDLLQNDFPESRIYFDETNDDLIDDDDDDGSGIVINTPPEIFRELKQQKQRQYDDDDNNDREIFRELKNKHKVERSHRIYTEGGVVYSPTATDSDDDNNDQWKENIDQILNEYNLGFKRPERLDVKKPGPPFDAQIYEKKVSPETQRNEIIPSMMKKGPIGVHPNPAHDNDYTNEMDYIYITFKNIFRTWKEGEYIIKNITKLLKFEQPITLGRIDHNEVTFKVVPNSRGLNATEVAKRIESIREELKTITGAEITSIGIGDKASVSAILAMSSDNEEFYIVIFLVCGVLAAMILASSILILIKRHLKSKEKLENLSRPDTEASKDYQDLCRARMAAKGQQQISDPIHGRITSLSRESEQSPSSRSSTSSWSEEPALHNMDISTGHMVLSYMEDHLKNKDRLEQEWVALCAYVAEPSDTTIALKKENVEKNRYPEIIPYDHSRVVLNELSNISGSDYINASTITDHDPRNPAYIATQGPLPHTAADFWQLIWEQGAVVIVMLTRLTESGAAMCHRYWPEEGSELYHIHEVHLVSEHIWCDDYLVRSFYLKNIRTGETRTVTQFHFLSWPEAGVPASTKALLEFRRKVNKSYRGRSCPIVVHCSDGAGRTGTYCLIDMVLSRMAKGAKEIDIAATLEHLRDQRPRMVATKQQFEFVLTAVAEEVHAILKALPPQAATNVPQQQQQQAAQQSNDKQEK